LANEITSLTANYCHTQDKTFLNEIKSVLKVVNEDLNDRPLPENISLRRFTEEDAITMEEAEQVVADFADNWPKGGADPSRACHDFEGGTRRVQHLP
jgi:hypothetical protein